jgi:4-hydroxybenzoate polyprenyltransferase
MKGIVAFLKLARLENSLLPVIALAAGFTAAKADNYPKLILITLILVLAHSVVTIWNDIADEVSDKHNNITRISDLKRSGAYNTLRWIVGSSVASIIVLLIFLPFSTKVLACLSLLLGWAYNVRPVQASRRPVLSIVLLGLAYGLIPFLLGASLGDISWPVIFLATGWTIGRSSLSLLKDYKDAKGDVAAQKRTFLLVYGGTPTARLSFGLALISYLACISVVAIHVHHASTAAFLLIPVAIWLLYERARLFRAQQYSRLDRIFHDCIRYQLIFDGLVVVCLRTL